MKTRRRYDREFKNEYWLNLRAANLWLRSPVSMGSTLVYHPMEK